MFELVDLYCESVWIHSDIKSAHFVCQFLNPSINRNTTLSHLFTENNSIQYSSRLQHIKAKYAAGKITNIRQPFWKLYRLSLEEEDKDTYQIVFKYEPLDPNKNWTIVSEVQKYVQQPRVLTYTESKIAGIN
jgi:succinate dehydrogenase flavin-adding protein (antitoxin of CptAB toxin-antitoxin module)